MTLDMKCSHKPQIPVRVLGHDDDKISQIHGSLKWDRCDGSIEKGAAELTCNNLIRLVDGFGFFNDVSNPGQALAANLLVVL